MNSIMKFIQLFFHLDKNLNDLIEWFGKWIYFILFFIIFSETGFILTPFLPGDSLIFISGALAASKKINLIITIIIFLAGAILGDALNYYIGKSFGNYLVKNKYSIIFVKNLKKTYIFYKKYGTETIIIARFIPILRTFAPFAAGMASMIYKKFFIYNVIGASLWVISIFFIGYFCGNIPVIKNNFTSIIILIILISILPGIILWIIKINKKNGGNK